MKLAVISMIRAPWGGSEELWAAMAARALEQGHEVMHSAFDFGWISDKEQQLIQKGLQLFLRRGYTPPGMPVLNRKLKKAGWLLRDTLNNPYQSLFHAQPDLVIYNGTAYSIAREKHLIHILHSSRTPYCIIGHYNSDTIREISDAEAALIRDCYTAAKKIFFVSQRTRETAERQLAMHITNAKIVRNPVNMQELSIIPFPETRGPVSMAMVGLLRVIHKGQDIVLEILSSPKWKEREWHLNIYGEGEDENYLKELVRFYELDSRVTFQGNVKDIRGLWASNQVLLMPSLMEGMPLALVEAMICGRPSVVTDVGGHTEWISEGREGFIAEAASRNSFGDAMERAWQHRHQWSEMGAAAHINAMQLYGSDPAGAFLEQIVQLAKN